MQELRSQGQEFCAPGQEFRAPRQEFRTPGARVPQPRARVPRPRARVLRPRARVPRVLLGARVQHPRASVLRPGQEFQEFRTPGTELCTPEGVYEGPVAVSPQSGSGGSGGGGAEGVSRNTPWCSIPQATLWDAPPLQMAHTQPTSKSGMLSPLLGLRLPFKQIRDPLPVHRAETPIQMVPYP
eukprot:gene3587-biopygen11282